MTSTAAPLWEKKSASPASLSPPYVLQKLKTHKFNPNLSRSNVIYDVYSIPNKTGPITYYLLLEHFLDTYTHAPPSEHPSTAYSFDFNELSEDDILFSPDFSASSSGDHRNRRTLVSSSSPPPRHVTKNFSQPESFGILGALAEHEPSLKIKTLQKASISSSLSTSVSSSSASSSRLIPSIPKPPQDRLPALSSSAKFHQHQSAPVDVPVFARVTRKQQEFDNIDDEEEEQGEMLPPHEIVAMGSARSPFLARSVLEGVIKFFICDDQIETSQFSFI